jgi:DNA-binding transcriptional ArsR family regulator
MASTDSKTVLGWLKAAGEDSRLRLLALCARQELSVSDLAEVLRQSEPRVSRHLRILCEAGLLERLRQGQWVHYRLTQDAAAAGFVQGLLGQLDRTDAVFVKDRQRAAARPEGGLLDAGGARRGAGAGRAAGVGSVSGAGAGRTADAGGISGAGAGGGGASGGLDGVGARAASVRTLESRLGRAIKGFVEAVDVAVGGEGGRGATKAAGVGSRGDPSEGAGKALVVGVEHLELLETAAGIAGECVAIAHSRRAAQSARAFAERRGFACRVLLAASSNALCEKDIDAATERLATERPAKESPAGARESPAGTGAMFDVVFLDHLAVPESALDGMLAYGRRALAPGGRLWLFERYESLEVSREKVVEHPIGRLRRLLGDVGLTCERLSPIEADGEHVLAAVAVPSRVMLRGAGTAGAA